MLGARNICCARYFLLNVSWNVFAFIHLCMKTLRYRCHIESYYTVFCFGIYIICANIIPHSAWIYEYITTQNTFLRNYNTTLRRLIKMILIVFVSFPPPYVTGSESDNWLLDTLAEDWSVWLPEHTKATIKK